MSQLLAGLLGVLVATNQPAAMSNLVEQTTGIKVPVAEAPSTDPVELELQKIMIEDDAAQVEVDKWIRDAREFAAKGVAPKDNRLKERVQDRLNQVRSLYDGFLLKHPDHAKARLAYGSFLNDIGEDHNGSLQWEKALELDPKNPAAWNNLANYYGHRSPVKKAFEYYAKAIELDPKEAVYYHNFGTTVFLFRKDAMEYYNINEQQVFDRALDLYEKAQKLDPDDFLLAQDIAQTYYGIKPDRTEEALQAWRRTLSLAQDEAQRQGVYLHLARFEMRAGRFGEAHKYLDLVTDDAYAVLKERVTTTLKRKETGATSDDATPAPAPAPKEASATK